MYLSGAGIAKNSKEYTVTLDTYGTTGTNGKNAVITVDDNAKIYFVDKDGNISESSYSAIYQDVNDKVYAIVEDYLVKTLIVEEVDDGTTPDTPVLSDDIEVMDVDIDTPNTTITYYVESGTTTLTTSEIKAILADKGCKDITKSGTTWSFTYDGMTFAGVTVDTVQVYKVSVKVADSNSEYATVTSVSDKYVAKDGTLTVKVTFKALKSATRTFAMDSTSTTGMTIDTISENTIDAEGVATLTVKVTSEKDGTVALSWS